MATNAGVAALRTTKASLARAKAAAKAAERRRQTVRATSELMKFLCDPARLAVILMLAKGEKHVGAISKLLGMTQPAVSHHLALLRHGQVVAQRRQGKHIFYGLTEGGRRLEAAAQSLAV